ncbi:unnamed protein product [Durusdinium trenchii]|uniref:Uncharacterized protein n=1 Tax=Durusdinium trenchii TaxID=1381693 RepID=A0ABP0PJ27_9DINO
MPCPRGGTPERRTRRTGLQPMVFLLQNGLRSQPVQRPQQNSFALSWKKVNHWCVSIVAWRLDRAQLVDLLYLLYRLGQRLAVRGLCQPLTRGDPFHQNNEGAVYGNSLLGEASPAYYLLGNDAPNEDDTFYEQMKTIYELDLRFGIFNEEHLDLVAQKCVQLLHLAMQNPEEAGEFAKATLRLPSALGLQQSLAQNCCSLFVQQKLFDRGPSSLPQTLGNLQKLRVFEAFENGRLVGINESEDSCPGDWLPNRSQCVLGYVSRADKTAPVWRCPVHGWNIRLDDMSLPWWRWRSIEKMHIDANFIYGHIPEDLPELWPNLRSLDLHDLKLSGPLPWSLRRLVNLTQLQVQLNDLYCPDGIDVVAGLMKMPKMRTFNIDANPTMCGCLPSKVPAHLRMQVGETAVRIGCEKLEL